MRGFNTIGISSEFDKARIAHLFKIGIVAAVMVLIGDMILGWGTVDGSLSGADQYFSRYLEVSNARIVWSAVLGLIGIPLESLCYFGVYRCIAVKSEKYAHLYRSGILGMLAFGGFVHVVCCAVIYHFKSIYALDPSTAADSTMKFALYFLAPVTGIFFVFFLLAAVTQIIVFAKGLTPFPKWCAVFSIVSGLMVIIIMKIIGNYPFTNALSTGWISLGSIWTFGGLLINLKGVEKS